ncbi:MAG: Mut7-C RNAse domain-containing protein [Halobacteriota archaeon]|nr:Mut7-C RNAse domain-containing protein [Halobacteriota archaeon]
MNDRKFIVDRMLGRLVTWLRILGYDTLYIKDVKVNFKEEDDLLLIISKACDRILITRDRTLAQRAERYKLGYHYMKPDKVMEQLWELSAEYNIELEPKMMRCSVCNAIIRKVDNRTEIELLDKVYVPERMVEEGADFWVCRRCGRVYWQGSHWDNMRRELGKLNRS